MSLLLGKLKPGGGRLFINERSDDMSRYRTLLGYVPQDDVMLPNLTVRDTLLGR
jgi:ABC-type multidrug transport system ATPase subunit